MKNFLFIIFAAVSLNVFAATTPIDRELESVVIQNPTLEGKYFCGMNVKIIDAAVFVCNSQGYSQTQILERAMVSQFGQPCWIVEPKVQGGYYFDFAGSDLVLTRVKCSRVKVPPIAQPVDPVFPDPNPKP